MNCFPRRAAKGFTLTELVVVIVIATILSAFAISRINVASFDTEGFANQTAAMVRYAQKIAISQRRDVFVVIASNTVSLCYTSGCGATALKKPPGTDPFSASPRQSGVSVSAIPATFSFNALGKPSPGPVTITVTGGDITLPPITVEAETGYVH